MVLAHELHQSDGAPVERWMLFLHGILGRGVNWRSFARRWLRARGPGWGAALVDLRMHGASQDFAGPHTVAAAANDLVDLAAAVEAERGGQVAGLLGHSFGGKVAIAGSEALAEGLGRRLAELWVIDSPPGERVQPRDRTTERVFAALERLPPQFATRDRFIEALAEAGIAKPIAQWLATNLRQSEAGVWHFALDLPALRQLLDDFAARNLWPQLEAEADAGVAVGLVLGGRSQTLSNIEIERARSLAGAGQVALETVAGAGHWVHVDDPAGLLAIVEQPPRPMGR